jgi:hypothetical protein
VYSCNKEKLLSTANVFLEVANTVELTLFRRVWLFWKCNGFSKTGLPLIVLPLSLLSESESFCKEIS